MFEYMLAESHGLQLVSNMRQLAREMPKGAGTMPVLAIERLADSMYRYVQDSVKPLAEEVRQIHTTKPSDRPSSSKKPKPTRAGEGA